MQKLKSWTTNLLLAFTSTILTLCLVEVGLRFSPYKDININQMIQNEMSKGYRVEDDELGFDIRKNFKKGFHQSGEFKYEIFSNSLGCFDYQRAVPNDYSLIVGDSFTWGYTPLEKKWTSYLESASGHFMLKCGVSGYGTRQEFLKAKKVIKQVKKAPKLIILLYYENDINDDFQFPYLNKGEIHYYDFKNGTIHFQPKSDINGTSPISVTLNKEPSAKTWGQVFRDLRYKSVFYNLFMYKIGRQLRNWYIKTYVYGDILPAKVTGGLYEILLKDHLHKSNKVKWLEELIKYHKQSINDFKKFAKANGSTFLLIDAKGTLDNRTFQELVQSAPKDNFYYYNLTDDYPIGKQNESGIWPIDGHWNIDGNQKVGKFIFEHFKKLGIF